LNYSSFIKSLLKIKDIDLSDEIIDNKMNFSSRIKELIELNNKKVNYRKSSVLILVYPSKDQIPKRFIKNHFLGQKKILVTIFQKKNSSI